MNAHFTHDGLTIHVSAPEPDIAWLGEFLGPAFGRDDRAAHDVTVSHTRGLGGRKGGTLTHAPIAFALDSGPVRLPASTLDDGIRLHHPRFPVEFDATSDGRHAGVRHAMPHEDARVRLMRVVREYAHNHALGTGGLVLHAAAVVVKGVAVAICGPKGAGKTTTAFRLLELDGVDYLSNDRLLMRGTHAPIATAVPTVVGVREGTRALMPDFAARLERQGDFRAGAEDRKTRALCGPCAIGTKWQFNLAQVAAAAVRPLHASAPIGAVVFAQAQSEHDSSVQRLDGAEAAVSMAASILCRESEAYTSDVFAIANTPRPSGAEIEARCQSIVEHVPCYSGRLAWNATQDETTRFLRSILERD